MRKAVYFFCTDYERDEVAPRVLNYLKENYDLKLSNFKFANRDVYEYHDDRGNLFSFVETEKVLSYAKSNTTHRAPHCFLSSLLFTFIRRGVVVFPWYAFIIPVEYADSEDKM